MITQRCWLPNPPRVQEKAARAWGELDTLKEGPRGIQGWFPRYLVVRADSLAQLEPETGTALSLQAEANVCRW